MRIRGKFIGLDPVDMGESVIGQLRRIVPDEDGRGLYSAEVYLDDPRFDALQQCLKQAGFGPKQRTGLRDRSSEYRLELWREYVPDDFTDCEFIQFAPPFIYKLEMGEDVDDMKSLNEGELDPEFHFLECCGDFFCSDRAKRLLEAENFAGLSFRPTILRERLEENVEDVEIDRMGEVIPWERWGPPWWQMLTDKVMPPLAPSMTLIRNDGPHKSYIVHPPLTDPQRISTPKEGLYTPVEMHYRAGDLKAVQAVDFARVLENFGRPMLIVSKRFYDVCQEHNLESEWVPVRIDRE